MQDELAQVRQATARFHNVDEATAAGYQLGWVNGFGVRILTNCVASPAAGALGYHYINPTLVADNAVDLNQREALVYESAPNGGSSSWQSSGSSVALDPTLPASRNRRRYSGCRCTSSCRLQVRPFYLMHAWIWKHNPSGMMSDWNPEVTCP